MLGPRADARAGAGICTCSGRERVSAGDTGMRQWGCPREENRAVPRARPRRPGLAELFASGSEARWVFFPLTVRVTDRS